MKMSNFLLDLHGCASPREMCGGLFLPLSRQSAHTFVPLQQLQNFYLSGNEAQN